MDTEEKVEWMKENEPRGYERFRDNGDRYVRILDDAMDELSGWTDAKEILETAEYSGHTSHSSRKFVNVYNMLCKVDALPAFGEKSPFNINANDYEKEKVYDLLEEVTGHRYPQEKQETETLLESLKDG